MLCTVVKTNSGGLKTSRVPVGYSFGPGPGQAFDQKYFSADGYLMFYWKQISDINLFLHQLKKIRTIVSAADRHL